MSDPPKVPTGSVAAGIARVLDVSSARPDPTEQFLDWLREAGVSDPARQDVVLMLATASPGGEPSVRAVLLRRVDERGLVFFTNYQSRKGRELSDNPRAAGCVWLPEFERQVRFEGAVARTSDEESDAYFRLRPRESQLGAAASRQSRVAASRFEIDQAVSDAAARFEGQPVARPANWGGIRVAPTAFEFWQGRVGRIHDRLRYERTASGSWRIERLWP